MADNEVKEIEDVVGPSDEFVGRDLLESYMRYRNRIPINPIDAFGIKKKCIEFGKELLPLFFNSDVADEQIKKNKEEQKAINKQIEKNKEERSNLNKTDEAQIKRNEEEQNTIDKQSKRNEEEQNAIDKQIEKDKEKQKATDELYAEACLVLKTEIVNRRSVKYEHLIRDHKVYTITAKDADTCEALPEEIDKIMDNFVSQQHEQHMERLDEVDNKIFHVLSKEGIIPSINPTVEQMEDGREKEEMRREWKKEDEDREQNGN